MMTTGMIADRITIIEVLHRYCRARDRIDAELGYSVWHEDGTADYGAIYCGSGRGFVDWAWGGPPPRTMLATSHRVTNEIIRFDGDAAGSESHVVAVLRRSDGNRLLQTTALGRYVDQWSRRNGRWAIDRRVYLHDFDEVREITTTALAGNGRRDLDDPSYQVLPR